MSNSTFHKLIKTIEMRKALEARLDKEKGLFEESIAVWVAQLDDVKNQEQLLREESLLVMDKASIDRVEEEGKVITKRIKETDRVEDPQLLFECFKQSKELLDAGIDGHKVLASFKPTVEIIDKKYINDVVKDYKSLTGKNPDGVETKSTIYLTVAQQNGFNS